MSETKINLTALREARAKMSYSSATKSLIEDAINEDNAAGIVATHNAVDVLLEIAEAALALIGPAQVSSEQLPEFNALVLALAKVTP